MFSLGPFGGWTDKSKQWDRRGREKEEATTEIEGEDRRERERGCKIDGGREGIIRLAMSRVVTQLRILCPLTVCTVKPNYNGPL